MTRSPAARAKTKARPKKAPDNAGGDPNRLFASMTVPPWVRPALRRPGGAPVVLGLGWLMLLAAAGSLAWLMAPQVSATIGTTFLTYDPVANASPAPRWLVPILVFGSLIGFNLVYWFSSPASRSRQLAYVLALYVAELLALMACVIWVTGAGYGAGAVFKLSAKGPDGAVGATALLVVCIAACGMMFWLGTSSTFEEQRGQYLHAGRTTVATTKIGVRAHALWVAGLVSVWALLLVPSIMSVTRAGDDPYGVTPNQPWPLKPHWDDSLTDALTSYAALAAVLWSIALSLLIEKLLYRGPWAMRAAASARKPPKASWLSRLIVKCRHWPFVLGATLATQVLFYAPVTDDDLWTSTLPVALGSPVVGALLSLLIFRWEWRVRDVNRNTLRLHLAGSV